MADQEFTYFTKAAVDVDRIEAGVQRMQVATDKATETFTKLGDIIESVGNKLNEIAGKPIIDPNSPAAAKSIEEFVSKLPRGFELSRKQAEVLFKLTKQAAELQKTIAAGQVKDVGKLLKDFMQLTRTSKELTKEMANSSKFAGALGFSTKDFKTDVKSVASQVTGLNLSLGGLIGLMVEAFNQGRAATGWARKAAGALGDGKTAIAATKQEMRGLRKEFALEYVEAGKVVDELTSMGFRTRDITSATEKEVSLTKELYAYQVKYGISVGTSGGFIKNMQQEYGKTNEEARTMLGLAKDSSIALREQGVPIGIQELIQDWGTLIDKTKAYRTDLLGVLSLYNTLMKEDIADKIGLGGVSKTIKLDIAKSMTSMALDMELGWKARLGEGASPAERAIRFEKDLANDPAKAFQRVIEEVEGMVGDIQSNPYEAEIRARMLLGQITGKGEKDPSVITLSRLLTEGKLSASKMGAFVEEQKEEKKRLDEERKNSKEGRKKLVTDAGEIAKSLQSIDALIKKWAIDTLMPWVFKIYDILKTIAAIISGEKNPVYDRLINEFDILGKANVGEKNKAFGISPVQGEQMFSAFAANAGEGASYSKTKEQYEAMMSKAYAEASSRAATGDRRLFELLTRVKDMAADTAVSQITSALNNVYVQESTGGGVAPTILINAKGPVPPVQKPVARTRRGKRNPG